MIESALAISDTISKNKRIPRVASNANDAEGAAGQSDLSSDSSGGNTQEAEEQGGNGVAGRRRAVAALDRAVVTLVGRRAASGSGYGEGGESEGGKSRENGELHV